jgi:hypothetical protein
MSRLEEVAEDVARLTASWSHAERLEGSTHISTHPSLLSQLRDALVDSQGGDPQGDTPKSIPESRMPVPEEPFAVLLGIRAAAKMYREDYGLSGTDEETLAMMPGIVARLEDEDEAGFVANEINQLRRRAEVALSWRLRSRTLRGACPNCNRRNTVVVQIDDHGPVEAACSGCRVVWEREHLGVLAGAMQA